MSTAELSVSDMTLNITDKIQVHASLEATFAALLEELGPKHASPDGVSMQLELEPWPGGRWFRNLGDRNGHYWGTVQAIKRLTLLEISGPLFMSLPVVNNVQYRLTENDGGTLISFHHFALGLVPDEMREGMTKAWSDIHARVKAAAE